MTTVLLVMKRSGNMRVTSEFLEAMGHTAVGVRDHEALAEALAQPAAAPIALVDTSDFTPADWLLCQTLRSHQVRFAVLCAAHEVATASHALRHGAASFLQKPVKKPLLLSVVSRLAEEPAAV